MKSFVAPARGDSDGLMGAVPSSLHFGSDGLRARIGPDFFAGEKLTYFANSMMRRRERLWD